MYAHVQINKYMILEKENILSYSAIYDEKFVIEKMSIDIKRVFYKFTSATKFKDNKYICNFISNLIFDNATKSIFVP